ncbi:MAG: 16S rRNA (adenine(1518)-N(6)/adenine(1519)-N(6))-dimethyltransferase RsmA [Buchnera aphidicola (Nurudea yanoniella)]
MTKLEFDKYFLKKHLGQHFLIDQCVVNKIISSMNPKKRDIMIEIGPGLGALTYDTSKFPCKLFLIEYDKHLAHKLFLLYKNVSNIQVFSKNALKFNFSCINRKRYESIRIFGNLPYNISIELLLYFFKYNNIICDMYFMLQKEVANRLLAVPGTKDYGKLSIISQYFCKIIRLFDIFPESFKPIPKVNSTFLKFVPCKNNKDIVTNVKNLQKITTLAFSQRRKIIKNSLSSLFNEDILISLHIDPKLRAEDLSVEQYFMLSNYIS